MHKPTALLIATALIGLSLAAPAQAGPEIKSNLGCSAQCIRSALLEIHPYAVGITVKTDTPARIRVGVAERRSPGKSGLTTDVFVDSAASPAGRTVWATHLTGLEADRLYEVVVSAIDAKGNVARRSGTFRTRSVETLGDGGPTSFDSGSGCAVQCITGATASVGSHDAHIEIDTLVSARVSVQADPKAPVKSAHGPVFDGEVAAQPAVSRTASTGRARSTASIRASATT